MNWSHLIPTYPRWRTHWSGHPTWAARPSRFWREPGPPWRRFPWRFAHQRTAWMMLWHHKRSEIHLGPSRTWQNQSHDAAAATLNGLFSRNIKGHHTETYCLHQYTPINCGGVEQMFLFIFKAISGNDDTIWHAQGKNYNTEKGHEERLPRAGWHRNKMKQTHQDWWSKNLWELEETNSPWQPESAEGSEGWNCGGMAGWFAKPQRFDAARQERGITSFGSGVSSAKMLCLSLPYLVSRII